MQVLITTGTAAGTLPIYLPYDKAPVPFGDPIACSVTAATPTIVTVPGYVPSQGDAVAFSVAGTSGFLTSLAGLTSIQFQLNTVYYVTSVSNDTFAITTTSGKSSNPVTVEGSITTLGQFGGQVFVHLLSGQADGPTAPFKSGATVLAMNAGAVSGTGASTLPITLFGAADLNTTLATGTYGAPLGPTGYAVLATIAFGAPKLVTLQGDWIVASGSTSTLVLIQN